MESSILSARTLSFRSIDFSIVRPAGFDDLPENQHPRPIVKRLTIGQTAVRPPQGRIGPVLNVFGLRQYRPHSKSDKTFRAASSSASSAATLAACCERASSITSSMGVERSSCSSLAARETAAAATATLRAR